MAVEKISVLITTCRKALSSWRLHVVFLDTLISILGPLAVQEIRQLCLTAKEVFMSQPNLLELEAPIKICGTYA